MFLAKLKYPILSFRSQLNIKLPQLRSRSTHRIFPPLRISVHIKYTIVASFVQCVPPVLARTSHVHTRRTLSPPPFVYSTTYIHMFMSAENLQYDLLFFIMIYSHFHRNIKLTIRKFISPQVCVKVQVCARKCSPIYEGSINKYPGQKSRGTTIIFFFCKLFNRIQKMRSNSSKYFYELNLFPPSNVFMLRNRKKSQGAKSDANKGYSNSECRSCNLAATNLDEQAGALLW